MIDAKRATKRFIDAAPEGQQSQTGDASGANVFIVPAARENDSRIVTIPQYGSRMKGCQTVSSGLGNADFPVAFALAAPKPVCHHLLCLASPFSSIGRAADS